MAKAGRLLGTIVKYALSALLMLFCLSLLGFALSPIGREEGGVLAVSMLLLLCTWCGLLLWFIHFRQRIALRSRRGMAVALGLFLPLWFLGVANMYRPSVYLEHRYWPTYESEHFVFHFAPDYAHRDDIASYAAVRDIAFKHNCEYLGVTMERKIDFYVHDELAGGHAEGWENMVFADHDQSVGHEMTHVIAYHIADKRQKIKLLDEGIATWLNHARIKVPMGHHGVAWMCIQEHGLAPLRELAHTRTFRRQKVPTYYPAASFVGYLIENYGLDAFLQLWTANAGYSEVYTLLEDLGLSSYFPFIPGEHVHFQRTVKETYGRTLDQLDPYGGAGWKRSADSRVFSPSRC